MAMTPDIKGWYRTLAKPAWDPPDSVFHALHSDGDRGVADLEA
jgi:hypothetical protein